MNERFMLRLVEMGHVKHPFVADIDHVGALVDVWESMDRYLGRNKSPSPETIKMWRDDLRIIYDWMMEHRSQSVKILKEKVEVA